MSPPLHHVEAYRHAAEDKAFFLYVHLLNVGKQLDSMDFSQVQLVAKNISNAEIRIIILYWSTFRLLLYTALDFRCLTQC